MFRAWKLTVLLGFVACHEATAKTAKHVLNIDSGLEMVLATEGNKANEKAATNLYEMADVMDLEPNWVLDREIEHADMKIRLSKAAKLLDRATDYVKKNGLRGLRVPAHEVTRLSVSKDKTGHKATKEKKKVKSKETIHSFKGEGNLPRLKQKQMPQFTQVQTQSSSGSGGQTGELMAGHLGNGLVLDTSMMNRMDSGSGMLTTSNVEFQDGMGAGTDMQMVAGTQTGSGTGAGMNCDQTPGGPDTGDVGPDGCPRGFVVENEAEAMTMKLMLALKEVKDDIIKDSSDLRTDKAWVDQVKAVLLQYQMKLKRVTDHMKILKDQIRLLFKKKRQIENLILQKKLEVQLQASLTDLNSLQSAMYNVQSKEKDFKKNKEDVMETIKLIKQQLSTLKSGGGKGGGKGGSSEGKSSS